MNEHWQDLDLKNERIEDRFAEVWQNKILERVLPIPTDNRFKIGSIEVDESGLANNKTLRFNSSTGKLEYYSVTEGSGAVDSVNTQIGDVVLNQDHILDGSTYGRYSLTERTKLQNIEANADVTDAGNVGSSIHGATAKTTPVDADTLALIDSEASNVLKKITWANIVTELATHFSGGGEWAGVDGGFANSVYLTYQSIDGGTA